MNRYELKITDNKTKKSHRMSSMSYSTLVETFFETSAEVFNAITDKSPYTVYVPIGNTKYIATYFPSLGGVCILHSVVDAPLQIHDAAFRELDFEEFERELPRRSWYYTPSADNIVSKIVSPYKLVLRDKTVAASTYDMGAICFYGKYTAVIAAIRNNIYGETRYSVYVIEKNMVFDNISKKDLRPDKYNSIVRWVPNND